MATLYTQQSKNVWRTWALMTVFFVVVILIGYFFADLYDSPGILYFAVLFSIFMNIFSYWFSDKVILKMYRATPVTRESNYELYTVVENLAITAGLPMPKVYIIPDQAPNAFATGRNKEHAAVVVTVGLLAILNRTELEGVIAHELSHIGNRDILISTVVVVLVGFISILSQMFLRGGMFGGFRNNRDNEGGLLVIVGIILAILSPIAATLIQLAISRRREYLADTDGALLTRYPEGLASALEKISQNAQPLRHANEATAHLFIANPFGKYKSKISTLFMTHPPTEDRIRILRSME